MGAWVEGGVRSWLAVGVVAGWLWVVGAGSAAGKAPARFRAFPCTPSRARFGDVFPT